MDLKESSKKVSVKIPKFGLFCLAFSKYNRFVISIQKKTRNIEIWKTCSLEKVQVLQVPMSCFVVSFCDTLIVAICGKYNSHENKKNKNDYNDG